MLDPEPVSAQPLGTSHETPTPWPDARRGLEEAEFYWLATTRRDGRAHVRPVLAVWVDGALHFVTSPASRKGTNLARDPRCLIAAAGRGLHLIVEGEATKVDDGDKLDRVAAAYASKYDWHVDVSDQAFYGDGAPTAGPPPYEVYEITPAKIFGFSEDGSVGAMRWRF